MRRAAAGKRRDANEAEIVAALRAFGAHVLHVSGAGLPDVLVCHRGRWVPLEIKTATGGLTRLQRERGCNGAPPIPVVRSVAEALAAIGVETEGA